MPGTRVTLLRNPFTCRSYLISDVHATCWPRPQRCVTSVLSILSQILFYSGVMQKEPYHGPTPSLIFTAASRTTHQNITPVSKDRRPPDGNIAATHGLIVGMVHHEIYSGYYYRERKKLTLMRDRYREAKYRALLSSCSTGFAGPNSHGDAHGRNGTSRCQLPLRHGVIDDRRWASSPAVLAFVAEMEREKIMGRTTMGRINKRKRAPRVRQQSALWLAVGLSGRRHQNSGAPP